MKTMGVLAVAGATVGMATAFQAGPQMVFGGNKNKVAAAQKTAANKLGAAKAKTAPAIKTAASKFGNTISKAAAPSKAAPTPLKKAAAPVKQAAATFKSAAAPAKKAAAPAKKAGTPLVRNVQKAATSLAKPAAALSGGADALAFGSDVEAGFWDPIQLAADKPAETLNWYRAAELKHGRVAMLATLGTFVQAAGVHLPDSPFDAPGRSFEALSKVSAERPGAIAQILLAIAAVEVLTLQLQDGAFPGDLGFDPANQIPTYEKQGKFDELRLKELKNGRLAMVSIIGIWVQEYLTGQGVFEQLLAGHISPVNDGQGYF